MPLEHFTVVHERGGSQSNVDAPLVHCFDGKQLVLAFVGRTALDDYFHLQRRLSMRDYNLLVDRNLPAIKRIIIAKYERGERSVYDAFGQSYPRVDVTLEDLQACGEELSASVLNIKATFV